MACCGQTVRYKLSAHNIVVWEVNNNSYSVSSRVDNHWVSSLKLREQKFKIRAVPKAPNGVWAAALQLCIVVGNTLSAYKNVIKCVDLENIFEHQPLRKTIQMCTIYGQSSCFSDCVLAFHHAKHFILQTFLRKITVTTPVRFTGLRMFCSLTSHIPSSSKVGKTLQIVVSSELKTPVVYNNCEYEYNADCQVQSCGKLKIDYLSA